MVDNDYLSGAWFKRSDVVSVRPATYTKCTRSTHVIYVNTYVTIVTKKKSAICISRVQASHVISVSHLRHSRRDVLPRCDVQRLTDPYCIDVLRGFFPSHFHVVIDIVRRTTMPTTKTPARRRRHQ